MQNFHITRDMVAGGAAVVLGVFFFIAAGSIQGFGDDPVGPKFLPQAICLLMIAIGAVLVTGSFRKLKSGADDEPSEAAVSGNVRPVSILAIVAVVYAGLFYGLGYLIASLIVFPVVLHLFGMRSRVEFLITTIATIAFFYVFFFVLLGVHDPPGAWIDVSGLLR